MPYSRSANLELNYLHINHVAFASGFLKASYNFKMRRDIRPAKKVSLMDV
jgi:hypothetical protein